ncbi:unnamed protein product [Porites evermanni]|uniref:Uncharacterized protein n=1 Tax=Porites evermanni TaxID=104178 RepID=A0ABN8PY03_9CNID|nr:unnamed protein product [Porites evermanni]
MHSFELIRKYHYHSFMARWLREQMDNVLEHLPLNEVVCYDYSEGYRCHQQDELQLEYFDVNVSLQSTILYHQAVESIDGMTSTENDPHIRWDDTQDYHSAHNAQELKVGYLPN